MHGDFSSIVEQVRVLSMSPSAADMLGGPFYSSDIERELRNGTQYPVTALPARQRVCLGKALFSGEEVVGYQVTTILRNATPLSEEIRSINLDGRQTYVQGKKLLVRPDFWGKGVSDILILQQLEYASHLALPFVTDVRADNSHMLRALARHHILPGFSWKSRIGTAMLRLRKDF